MTTVGFVSTSLLERDVNGGGGLLMGRKLRSLKPA
jgi:hypothetical protein